MKGHKEAKLQFYEKQRMGCQKTLAQAKSILRQPVMNYNKL